MLFFYFDKLKKLLRHVENQETQVITDTDMAPS